MLTRIIDHLDAGQNTPHLPALRAIAYGGGKMPQAVIERAMQLFPGVAFTNAYGLTETSSTICLLDPDDHRDAAASTDMAIRKRLSSVGKPLATIELQVRGDDGNLLDIDVIGDVYVRGDQVSGEYLGVGSLLDADGWFPTRDRGYLDAGGYLFLDGRADDVIVRGGENISPGEIEEILLAHPAVADAAVVAMPSQQWGETIAAAVVLKSNKQVSSVELQQWVKNTLRSSRVPETILFKDQLPYNEMGKILRRVIKLDFQ
jgi:acyl-CoA synthetase (AMP-forming)/AMP-acid ligase II